MTKKELLELATEMSTNIEKRRGCKIPAIRSVTIHRDGNFTLARINGSVYGMSKRNPIDPYNPRTGTCMALNRAIYNLVQSV